jgi:hypothetical protein
MNSRGELKVTTIWRCLLLSLGFAIPTVFGGCDTTLKPVPPQKVTSRSTEKQFREKVAELRMEKNRVERAIAKLEQSRQESLEILRKKGVKSIGDVGSDDALKFVVRNFKADTDEIAKLQENLGSYDKAINSINAMLDEIERKQVGSVALTEDQYLQLQEIVVDLNETLGVDKNDIFADEKLNDLLTTELGKSGGESKSEKSDEVPSKSAGKDQ